VEKPNFPELSLIAVCPSCGVSSPDSPHGTSDLCVRALEAEVARLSELIEAVRKRTDARSRGSVARRRNVGKPDLQNEPAGTPASSETICSNADAGFDALRADDDSDATRDGAEFELRNFQVRALHAVCASARRRQG
jgi:hypothetical protein